MSKESAEGPLQERLRRLSNLEQLRSRSLFLPPPELRLDLDTAEVATDRLRVAWSRIYLPHESHLMLMRDMVDRAVRSVEKRYPSRELYMKARYSGSPPSPEEQVWCVTGLAGISKSATMTAIHRVFASVEASGGFFPEMGIEHEPQLILHVQIGALKNVNEILSGLANPLFLAHHKKAQLWRLKDHLREWLYAQSTLLIVVDELQFLTRSSTASTLIANTISALSELGPPVFYTSNYSLGQKLMRRPQEDKDRLLARVTLLDPPSSNDAHWAKVLTSYLSIAPGRFDTDISECADQLHRLTAGLYRALKDLLCEACRIAWLVDAKSIVTMNHIRQAYRSPTYTSHRTDIEALEWIATSAQARRERSDLVSPFSTTQAALPNRNSANGSGLKAQVPLAVAHMIESSAKADARVLLEDLRHASDEVGVGRRRGATVTKISKRLAMTPASLRAGLDSLSTKTAELRDTSGTEEGK